jgi:serine/threonine protein kinase
MASSHLIPASANDIYLPTSVLFTGGQDGTVFGAVPRSALADSPKPVVALKVLGLKARNQFRTRQATLLADLKAMQERNGDQHPVVSVLAFADDLSWHSMSIVPGRTARDLLDTTYPQGLPPPLLLHIVQELVAAQQYLKDQAVSRCHRDLKPGRNVMLSLRANHLPKVTIIDFNGIHPWREHKVVEHVVMLAWRLMAQAESVPEVFRLSKYSEETLEEADLFYETLRRYQCRPDSTFAALKVVMERFAGGLKNVLRDEQEEVKWGAVLEQPLITAEVIDKAIEDGGLGDERRLVGVGGVGGGR